MDQTHLPEMDASFIPNTGTTAEPIEKTSGGEKENLRADEKLTSQYKQAAPRSSKVGAGLW